MVTDLKTLRPSITIDKAMYEYFLRYGYGRFPGVENAKFFDTITLREVKEIPREDWRNMKVSGVFVPHDKKWEAPADPMS
jgi:hypothetical protein